jgi:UDP-glucose 4-epimerase
MKILVTGGAGFIGSHVAGAFLKAGHTVTVLDNLSGGKLRNLPKGAKFLKMDIRDGKGLRRLFSRARFDVVDHHAAQMSVPDSVRDPLFDADVNVRGLLELLEAGRMHGLKKFIHISSGGTVYGEPAKLPARETMPIVPTSPYGITKAVGEDYLRFYALQYGLNYTVLRYSNVYGPRQEPHGEAGVVAIFAKKMLAGEAPKIFGDGGVIRDYVYVEDVAAANLAALRKGSGEAFNIGTGKPTTVRELYANIATAAGFRGAPVFAPSRAGDLAANWLSNTKARGALGWRPRVALAVGITRTVEHFRAEA